MHHVAVIGGNLSVTAAVGQTGAAAGLQKEGPGELRLEGAKTFYRHIRP